MTETWEQFDARLKTNRLKKIEECKDAKEKKELILRHQCWESTRGAIEIMTKRYNEGIKNGR